MSNGQVYQFGDFRIDTGQRLLLRGGATVPLTPKVFDTLVCFVTHQGELLDKQQLMAAIWPDTIVEENNLNQNISALRRALGEARGENRFIATMPGRGYCFTAEVCVPAEAPENQIAAGQIRVGVLPFDNLGGGPDREYLADGLTEETIAAIGQIDPSRFSVIGRTSVMSYKHTQKTLAEIGDELEVTYLVESSMRAEGSRFRITSKLISVRNQTQIWSASYDSEPSSFLALQREMSVAIAEQVRLRLSPHRPNPLAQRQTQNADAYDLYLRGRFFWNQFTPQTTQRAIEYFTRATELDHDYALAWSGLSDAFCSSPVTGDSPPQVLLAQARAAAAHAVRSDPGLAEAQGSLGFFQFWLGWDWGAAERAFRKSIAADPNYSFAYRMLGITLSHCQRHIEAGDAMRRCRELDPLSAMNRALSSQIAFAARDLSSAMDLAREAIVIDPHFWIGHFQLAQVYVELQEENAALESLNQASRMSGGNSKALSLRGYLLATRNHRREALEVLLMLEGIAKSRFIPPYAIALIHAGLGDIEQSLAWLERSLGCHDVHLAFLTIDPKWDSFRSDPRFVNLLQQCPFSQPSPSSD